MKAKITLLFALVLLAYGGLMAVTGSPMLIPSDNGLVQHESMNVRPAGAPTKANTAKRAARVVKRAEANVEMKSLTYDEASAKKFNYSWTDASGEVHESKLTETATDPRQMIAMLKHIYTNKDIPGPKYSAWDKNFNREDPVDYSSTINGGWNISGDYTPNVEGYSVVLVAMKNSADSATVYNNYTGYTYSDYASYYKVINNWGQVTYPSYTTKYSGFVLDDEEQLINYFTLNFDSIMFLTNGIRIGSDDDYTRGTVFNYNGTLNRFFYLGKGQARKKADYVQNRQTALNKTFGEVFPFKSMFEQFSPTSIDSDVETANFYDKLYNDQERYGVIHDCGTVPVYQHYFSMSGKKGQKHYALSNLQFYCPDYRLAYWEDDDYYVYIGYTQNSSVASKYDYYQYSDGYYFCYNIYTVDGRCIDPETDAAGTTTFVNQYYWHPTSAKWANYNADYAPQTMLYTIKLNAEADTIVGDRNHATVDVDWESSLDRLIPSTGVDELYTLYIVTYDSNGKRQLDTIPVNGDIKTTLQEYLDTVPRYEYSYEITYVVSGRPYNVNDTDPHSNYGEAWSNEGTVVIPGWDEFEGLYLVFDHYESDYDIDNEQNHYRNYFALRNGLLHPIMMKNLSSGSSTIDLYRYPDSISTSGTKWATINLNKGESNTLTAWSDEKQTEVTYTGITLNYTITYDNEYNGSLAKAPLSGDITSTGVAHTVYTFTNYYKAADAITLNYKPEETTTLYDTDGNAYTFYIYPYNSAYSDDDEKNYYYMLTDSATVVNYEDDDELNLSSLLVADWFSASTEKNDHAFRYGYRAFTQNTVGAELVDLHSNPLYVPVYKHEVALGGYYTKNQVDEVDRARTLTLNVTDANVATQVVNDNDIMYYDVIRSVGVPTTGSTDIESNIDTLQRYQRLSSGEYKEYPNGSTYPVEGSTWFINKYDTFNADMTTTEPVTNDAVYYVPVVSTMAKGRLDSAEYNTYGCDIKYTGVGSVTASVVLDRGTGDWATWTNNGTKYAVYTPTIDVTGKLPDVVLKNDETHNVYEPYMYRVWVTGTGLRDFKVKDGVGTVEDAGEYTDDNYNGYVLIGEYFVDKDGLTAQLGGNVYENQVDNRDPNSDYLMHFGGPYVELSEEGNNTSAVDFKFYVRFYYKKTDYTVAPYKRAPRKVANTDIMWYAVEDPAVGPGKVTGINDVLAGSSVVSTTYYNTQGMQSNTPFDGVNIVVTRYSDGSSRTTKVVK